RSHAVDYDKNLRVLVEREKARCSAWYEMFPRSASPEPGRHGTFRDVEARLPYVAEMGFDILYLPPIHPVGRTFRKGKNNAVVAEPGDVGSPWAIGGPEGGHKSINPELGTFEDFRHLLLAAKEKGIEVALDIAFQCSPDHPYVKEHPEWFLRRPDGTIQYAENPPKKYQDIYPFHFDCEDWRGLWRELCSIFLFWAEQGVRVFRVDNPHTKPFAFWEWCIGEVRRRYPEAIFLSEAFTRPHPMYQLAKVGFTQSYTYFAWKNSKQELMQWWSETVLEEPREYYRPNLWPNTPDILNAYLQHGGRPAFIGRLVLAATMGASYGIYGPAFELVEHVPREQGSEEYIDSEKYQLRHWDLDKPGSLRHLIARVNGIRREHPALHSNHHFTFHSTDNDQIICYSKRTRAGDDVIVSVVNLDPYHVQSGWVDLDLGALGVSPEHPFQAHDLLTGARYLWHGSRNFVSLDPHVVPAHVLHLRRHMRTEHDFDYFT
ncbi:MAG: alpha-amylase family glycosyl hydrolase, partial [Myxococcota bacterium]